MQDSAAGWEHEQRTTRCWMQKTQAFSYVSQVNVSTTWHEVRFDYRARSQTSLLFFSLRWQEKEPLLCSCFITYNSLQMAGVKRDAVSSHNNRRKGYFYKGKF